MTSGADQRVIERVAALLPAYLGFRLLNAGGSGEVYTARHRALDRAVAVKRLTGMGEAGSVARERFLLEARTLSALDHPHVVTVYDYVETDDLCLIVMELLDGGDLLPWITRRAAVPDVCAVGLAASSGLAYTHDRQILHRDVKPQNLLFSSTGVLRLADFGVAKDLTQPSLQLTSDGQLVGSPAYMAPEQVVGDPVGPSTDVYALGLTLYELLTGAMPFEDAPDLPSYLARRVVDEAVPPDEAAGVPTGIARVVMSALEREPTDRPQTADEFGARLASAANESLGSGWLAGTEVRVFPRPQVAEILQESRGAEGEIPMPQRADALDPSLTVTQAPSGCELEVRDPTGRTWRVLVDAEVLVGRKVDGIRLPDSEVSRAHCRLVPTPAGLRVEDLGSTNGTFLNGSRLEQDALLRPGDRLDLGDSTLWLRG